MKCLILAGGAGNHMWPVSRKNYPKQFVYLDGEHSMFQNTILRNMAFCDEFWIMSQASYKNIINNQMKPFAGVKYRCFYEEEGKMTAPSLLFACMYADPQEDFLVVSTDNIISDGNYKETIVAARKLVEENKIVTLGINKEKPSVGVGFLLSVGRGVNYIFPENERELKRLAADSSYLMDTGILMGRVEVFLREFKKHTPYLFRQIKELKNKIEFNNSSVFIPAEFVEKIKPLSIADAITTKSERVVLLEGCFECERVRSLETLANILNLESCGHVVKNECSNVSVINFSDDQFVVANALEDVVVVNTGDAVYVSKKGFADNIKSIITSSNNGIPKKLLDESHIYHTLYGYRYNLQLAENYWVRKVTVYPGCSLKRHKHSARSESWVVLKGEATVLVDDECYIIGEGESINIERGMVHQLINNTFENVVFIETAVGEIIKTINDSDTEEIVESMGVVDNIIRMAPYCMEKIWGGTKLIDKYKKKTKGCNIAESWEVSAHPNGQSVVATGRYKGMPFGVYLNIMGKAILGWKAQFYDRFPVLVKFIDARENLSVQVHPGDDYALANENQYGKNEMWYIIEAEESSCIYCGFNGKFSKEEIERRTRDNTLTEIMKAIPVKKGETYFIPTGTVHAIGSGILLCEIQQNSDVTYRLYDYGRIDKYGNTRDLHIKKALDVLKPYENLQQPVEIKNDSDGESICKCKYFTVERILCKEKAVIWGQQSSFTVIIVISGKGSINVGDDTMDFVSGESYFSPAGKKPISIIGDAEVLTVRM